MDSLELSLSPTAMRHVQLEDSFVANMLCTDLLPILRCELQYVAI